VQHKFCWGGGKGASDRCANSVSTLIPPQPTPTRSLSLVRALVLFKRNLFMEWQVTHEKRGVWEGIAAQDLEDYLQCQVSQFFTIIVQFWMRVAGRDPEGAVPLTHITVVENPLHIARVSTDMWSELQWRAAKPAVCPTRSNKRKISPRGFEDHQSIDYERVRSSELLRLVVRSLYTDVSGRHTTFISGSKSMSNKKLAVSRGLRAAWRWSLYVLPKRRRSCTELLGVTTHNTTASVA
jgi:hypothetical protein